MTAAFRARSQPLEEFSADDLKEARDELIEALMDGRDVGFPKIDLEALLDKELDRNYAATLRALYEHFANIGGRDAGGVCLQGDAWMRRLCEAHVDTAPYLIEEKAAQNASDRLEDARDS